MTNVKVLKKMVHKELKMTNSSTLQDQWDRFMLSGYMYSRFTKDLYNAMYTKGSFISHFNRNGFYKARFCSIADLDYTMELMNLVPELQTLLNNSDIQDLITSRLNVARMEYSILVTQKAVIESHIKALKAHYNEGVI